ncbi:AAA family ATPase, partial [Erwinia sp. P7711]|uniref:AAA family ATPase n=1 Tax=Erwinia sp. P7711 TaxID=3141451 RepID=UPI003198A23A
SEFSINYENKFYSISIENKKNINKNVFSIICSEEIDKSIKHIKKHLKKLEDSVSSEPIINLRFRRIEDIRTALTSCLFKDISDARIEQIMYIPAGRSFFANLQKNVFSFLSSSINIDYFLTEFGSIYEQTKSVQFAKFAQKRTPPHVNKLVESLICGKHTTEKGQDWITTEHGRINVANSSSGQQEALPMALMLATWPYVRTPQVCRSFVIEEPEAHLFPFAQGTVVSMIANSHYASDNFCSHTITTHSPYILTAINNLIQAGNAEKALVETGSPAEELKKLYTITPQEEIIYFDEVRAYMIDNGTASNILNIELKLIDANSIDKISNVFSDKFNSLVEIEMLSQIDDEDDNLTDFGKEFSL